MQASMQASKQGNKYASNRDEEEEGAKISFKIAENKISISLEFKYIY